MRLFASFRFLSCWFSVHLIAVGLYILHYFIWRKSFELCTNQSNRTVEFVQFVAFKSSYRKWGSELTNVHKFSRKKTTTHSQSHLWSQIFYSNPRHLHWIYTSNTFQFIQLMSIFQWHACIHMIFRFWFHFFFHIDVWFVTDFICRGTSKPIMFFLEVP